MAEKKSKLQLVGCVMVVVALILAIVGMFVGEITATATMGGQSESESIKLFDEGWGEMGAPSNAFAVISFVVLIIGLVAAVVEAVLRVFLNKEIKIFTIVAGAVVVVGAILVLVSGLVLAGKFPSVDTAMMKLSYSPAIGVWLAFIGGLLGGVFALLPAFKK